MISAGRYTYIPDDIDYYAGVELSFGNFCSIGSGLKIYSGQHACVEHPEVVSTFAFKEVLGFNYPESKMGGFVKVGNDVWIGTDVRILEGVTIGDGAIIGAGAVVAKDVKPYAIVVGNPGKTKKYRFNKEQIKTLLLIKWWDWTMEDLMDTDLNDIDKFTITHINL